MSPKVKTIIGWTLTGLIVLVFIKSMSMKLLGSPEAIKHSLALGLSAQTQKVLGILELLSVILFVIPRTGLLGTLLLAAYLGGAIATHIEHAQSASMAIIIQCLLWITAAIRFPELSRRLLTGNAGII
jgi:ABC-type Na+ efflux pump permease subunit